MSNVDDDLANSRTRFEEIVWPEISEWFGDDPHLHRTEDKPGALREDFDCVGGVDYWVVERGAGMVSIASRVQTYDKTTFTVRYSRGTGNDTEYQKRMRQLNSHYELPTYTVQAYVDATLRALRNVAAVKTSSLYEYIATGTPGEDWPLIPSNENEFFFPVSWSELQGEVLLRVHDRHRSGLGPNPTNPEDITAYTDGGENQ
jgi:hypothetical protein